MQDIPIVGQHATLVKKGRERCQALTGLDPQIIHLPRTKEQLDAGHIEPSNSPWNTPIFVIPKKGMKAAPNHYYTTGRIVIKKDPSPLAYVTIIQTRSRWAAPVTARIWEPVPASGKSYVVRPPVGEASKVTVSGSSLIYPKISKPE